MQIKVFDTSSNQCMSHKASETSPSTNDETSYKNSIQLKFASNKKPLYFMVLTCFSVFAIMLTMCGIFLISSYTSFSNKELQELSPQAQLYKKFVNEINKIKNIKNILIEFASVKSSGQEIVVSDSYSGNINVDHLKFPKMASAQQCRSVPVDMRFDCFPTKDVSKENCESRGCCWGEINKEAIPRKKNFKSKLHPSYVQENINKDASTKAEMDVPCCFYPSDYSLYNTTDIKFNRNGVNGKLKQTSKSGYPNDVSVLKLEVRYETCSRIRIRIFDANHQRWETPLPVVPAKVPGCPGKKLYKIEIIEQNGQIIICRSNCSVPLFDMRSAAPLIFSDQFIQISTLLTSPFIYGLGQHLDGLLLDLYWKRKVFWNKDGVPIPQSNLYGSHPFYLAMERSGLAHGVFLLNSNAMDVILQPTPALTFRTIGGIIDMYVFLGPSPDDVISQYTEVVGRPILPPYWSLGYHQCRFGYGNLKQLEEVWTRTREAGIPFDVQWSDIDYMKNQNDFTYNNDSYAGLPKFVDKIHELGMHYVIIVDPGISAGEKPGMYPPYDSGMKDDVFIKNSTGDLFIGKVWNPIATVFPDFTLPRTVVYWTKLIQSFRKELPFDGLWIDMNEPSNFWNGQKDGCSKDSLEEPYYLPSVSGGLLYYKTLCMRAKQYLGPHYNVHNLYGISEAIATYAALKMTEGIEEPFIISRSSFPGLGAYSGHWTGDVVSDWFNMWKSIGDVLTTNLMGIPMVGADICGFNGNTTKALCNRWMQLGAFYPFSRNHNTDNAIEQDPVAMGELVVNSSRKALLQRYTLLPFLYTLFYKAYTTGVPVAKPLFFRNPEDLETYLIDTQFTWGENLMIIPVLEENVETVVAYFPKGKWYDWYSGTLVSGNGKEYLTLDAPLDTIPVVIAGGSILPCQNPANTTTQSRLNPFGLVVALNENNNATGDLTRSRSNGDGFLHWEFRAYESYIHSRPSAVNDYEGEENILEWINIFGVQSDVHWLSVNGVEMNYTYSAVSQIVRIDCLSVDFNRNVVVIYY